MTYLGKDYMHLPTMYIGKCIGEIKTLGLEGEVLININIMVELENTDFAIAGKLKDFKLTYVPNEK